MTTTLSSNYSVTSRLCLGVTDILTKYMFGVKIEDGGGNDLRNQTEVIEFWIESAQTELENYLGVKLLPQCIFETKDFNRDDFLSWGYLRTTYPVNKPIGLVGKIGDIQQIKYPNSWLSVKQGSNPYQKRRAITIVPQGATSNPELNTVSYSGIIPTYGLTGNANIPNYWNIYYTTGFETIPKDILNFIGMLTSINLFHIAGDLIIGAGIASQSIGIDGLSESISTTSSATNAGYGARILGYVDTMEKMLATMKAAYSGINFAVC